MWCSGPPQAPPEEDEEAARNQGTNLFVTGIATRLTESDVARMFEKYGEVEKCNIMRDPHTRESRGFGFVNMTSAQQADAAKEGLQGEVIEGRTLSIEKARRAKPRTPTPGKYFGPPKRGVSNSIDPICRPSDSFQTTSGALLAVADMKVGTTTGVEGTVEAVATRGTAATVALVTATAVTIAVTADVTTTLHALTAMLLVVMTVMAADVVATGVITTTATRAVLLQLMAIQAAVKTTAAVMMIAVATVAMKLVARY